MKTIERLKELKEVERRACGSSNMMRYVEAVGNTATAAHNALPALLAVVEAQAAEIEAWLAVVEAQAAEIEAWRTAEEECRAIENACDMNAARAYIAKSRDNTDAALRALEGGE